MIKSNGTTNNSILNEHHLSSKRTHQYMFNTFISLLVRISSMFLLILLKIVEKEITYLWIYMCTDPWFYSSSVEYIFIGYKQFIMDDSLLQTNLYVNCQYNFDWFIWIWFNCSWTTFSNRITCGIMISLFKI
jgi:hypothetical protein